MREIAREEVTDALEQGAVLLGIFSIGLAIGAGIAANRVTDRVCGSSEVVGVTTTSTCGAEVLQATGPLAEKAAVIGLGLVFVILAGATAEVLTDE